jgi:hypothetical protein
VFGIAGRMAQVQGPLGGMNWRLALCVQICYNLPQAMGFAFSVI